MVEGVANQFLSALSNGDVQALDALISRDECLFVGTDNREWWSSRSEIMRALQAQTKEMEGFEFVASTTVASEHGEVGWFATQFAIRAPDGTETPSRLTGTVVREQGTWRIVQGHTSVGAANEEVIGKELTI